MCAADGGAPSMQSAGSLSISPPLMYESVLFNMQNDGTTNGYSVINDQPMEAKFSAKDRACWRE